jgi:hypothetical protein
MQPSIQAFNFCKTLLGTLLFLAAFPLMLQAQDKTKSKVDPNDSKMVKKVNSLLDSTQKKITKSIVNKTKGITQKADTQATKMINKNVKEVDPSLPYERLLNKKYTLGRRAYQNTVAQYNYLFNAQEELNDIIQKARNSYKEDYGILLNFYDYDLNATAKQSIDSIIYRCNANIVLHDLRNNWVDDSYLLLAKAYLYHKNFDTAGSILQFINYSFDAKENGMDLPIGSNLRKTNGKFSIATKEDNRIFENANVRNESMVWQARNLFETKNYNEGISLLQLLKADELFPIRLHPFLNEQLAYGYYLMESYENAATYLIQALPNAPDALAKGRWYYLIAQLWQKSNKIEAAYTWYKKANEFSPNPIIGVYSKINMVRIESVKNNRPWEQLAHELESMTKRDRYKPYADIIYLEMAQLAIQNNHIGKANEWLVKSIKNNYANPGLKQNAFESLGEINYSHNNYGIAKIAYDSLNNVLKTNPQYETISLRKKWLSTILTQSNNYQLEDSLETIYKLPKMDQDFYATTWHKRQIQNEKNIANLFSDKDNKYKYSIEPDVSATVATNIFLNSNSGKNEFYFDNKNTISQGKQSFAQKWGERPNVDQWRRKTSTPVVNSNIHGNTINSNAATKDTSNTTTIKPKIGKDTSLKYTLITDANAYKASLLKWNKAALSTAQTFMLSLNDFEKAKPIYQKIINKNIDSTVTERAYLDLASEYLHRGELDKSNELIRLVSIQFPKGSYATKKQEDADKRNKNANVLNQYKEAYFASQIGDWNKLTAIEESIGETLKKTKWYLPMQFLKVKMYAQQKQDALAISLLETIINESKSDVIKEKARNIIAEIKNRKDTEAYLTSLQIIKEQFVPDPIISANNTSSPIVKIDSSKLNKDSTTLLVKATTIAPRILFEDDSTAPYFVAFVTNNIKPMYVKEMQNAFLGLNSDEFPNLKLKTTFVQFQEGVYIVWIGGFEQLQKSKWYLNKIKPRLKKEIISFVPEKQYEMYLISKPNILLIKTMDDLQLYKEFMLNKIYKP